MTVALQKKKKGGKGPLEIKAKITIKVKKPGKKARTKTKTVKRTVAIC